MKLQQTIKLAVLGLGLLMTSACNNSSGGTYIECGGPQQFTCPGGMFCNLVNECGGIDGSGVCQRIPTECPNVDAPVCGCDKKTYASKCYAMASLQSIAYEGACLSNQ